MEHEKIIAFFLSLLNTKSEDPFPCTVHNFVTDDLAMQKAKPSIAMVLTQLSQIIPVSVPEGLKFLQWTNTIELRLP